MLLSFIFLPPLMGFLLNSFLASQSAVKARAGLVGSLACLASFSAAVLFCLLNGFKSQHLFIFPWFSVGDLSLSFSFTLDSLSLLFTLLITGVGSLIHIYSLAYMSKDPGLARYFAYLNLFVFMMLVLVLADSLPLLFVGWEGVGLCSYLLIGFWFKKPENTEAGLMAFIVNRIGDSCFLLGAFLLFFHFETLSFLELNSLFASVKEQKGLLSPGALGGLLLFLGATGKSAQIPLYFWLDKAMAGPTPVSALIHAATMVTAGIYMIVRLSGFYSAFPDLLSLMAWTGALTALSAALVACRGWDLKKILAYSTISQLGLLFMAVGGKAFSAGVFHLISHGFFKALLFLCAGSVIHSLKGERDIRFMGGLRRFMPFTFWTGLAGALALMAFPPLSGFFSKDEILWSLFAGGNYGLFFMAFAVSLCTVFYTTRFITLIFFGSPRFKTQVRESSFVMLVPMMILALGALFGGALGLPHLLSDLLPWPVPHVFSDLLKEFSPLSFKGSKLMEAGLMFFTTVAGAGLAVATGLYYLNQPVGEKRAGWRYILERAFFVHEGIKRHVQPFFKSLSQTLLQHVEQAFFSRGILLLSRQTLKLKEALSILQNGNLQFYALYFTIGLAVLTTLVFLR